MVRNWIRVRRRRLWSRPGLRRRLGVRSGPILHLRIIRHMWMILRFRPTLVLRMILVQPVLVFAVVDSFLRPIVVVIVASVIPSVG